MRANVPPTTSGQRLGGERLGQTGHRLEQHVTAGEQGDEQSLEQPALADDDPAHLEEDALDLLGGADVVHRRRVVSGHWTPGSSLSMSGTLQQSLAALRPRSPWSPADRPGLTGTVTA